MTAFVLSHLSHFVGGIIVDQDGTTVGAKLEKKLAKMVEALQKYD